MSSILAVCVSPGFDTPGWKPLTVGVGNEETMDFSASSQFYAGKLHVGDCIVNENFPIYGI